MSTNVPDTLPDLELGDEPYDSAEDEDFELDDAAAQDDSDASVISDDEDTSLSKDTATKKRKLDSVSKDAELLELDSGDEATIRKAKKKKSKKARKDGGDGDEGSDVEIDEGEDGGAGGFVKTRAMRMRIQEEERKPLAKIDGATIDVDAIWAKMNAPEPDGGSSLLQNEKDNEPAAEETAQPTGAPQEPTPEPTDENALPSRYADEMIKIKRTYKFAGEFITEEKIVPKNSAEAKVYLASGETAETVTAGELDGNPKSALKLRRPLRKISRFDPNPTGSIKKSWEKQQQSFPGAGAENVKGPKINVVDKSRLDWAAFVDKEGIKDDLVLHSKAKEGYLGRMDFLGRVDAKREEERRNARLKGL